MRFLMLNWRDPKSPLAGGAERVTYGYLSGLADRGHEVFWFSHSIPGAPSTECIGPVQIVRGGGVGSSILEARRWHRSQKRFDLVIDQHHGIPWYAPWWSGTRCVAYIHEVLGPIWSAFYKWPLNTIGRAQERWTHWAYRRIPFWTASQSTSDTLCRHGVKNVTLIPYGVATPALPMLEPKPLGQPVELIVVSRLAPNKRIDHALRALRLVRDRGLKARLTVVGTGGEETRLRQIVAEERLGDVVQFTGALREEEKDRRLREAHFLLHTSQREGWGLNVIEANAMGTPAIVYPVAGLIESTLHNQTGLVSGAETPEALADSVQAAVAAPERYPAFRRQAWERAKTFHWDAVLPQACDWLERKAKGAA